MGAIVVSIVFKVNKAIAGDVAVTNDILPQYLVLVNTIKCYLCSQFSSYIRRRIDISSPPSTPSKLTLNF